MVALSNSTGQSRGFQSSSLPSRAGTSHNLVSDPYAALLGMLVVIPTLCHGNQTGMVLKIAPNPFYGGKGKVAYVVSLPGLPGWSEYIPLDELPKETCCDCGKHYYEHQLCSECGCCFADCDCPPVMVDPVDELDGDPDYLDFLYRADCDYEDRRDGR